MAESLVAVVTGASAGIGSATVRALASDGYDVVAGARRKERLTEVCDGISATAVVLDVTDPQSVVRFVQAVSERYGHVDVLVNNAGVARRQDTVAEGRDEDWAQMLEVNVLGLLRMTRSILPLLRQSAGGHIVNVGSTSGFEVYPGGVVTRYQARHTSNHANAPSGAAGRTDPGDGDRARFDGQPSSTRLDSKAMPNGHANLSKVCSR